MNKTLRLWILGAFTSVLFGCASLQQTEDSREVLAGTQQLQTAATTQISPQLLKEELALIRARLLAIHPQPFARLSSVEFEAAFQRLNLSLNRPMSPREFYFKLAPLVAQLKDVHSYLELPKELLPKSTQGDSMLFPLAIVVEQQKVYVAADLSDQPLIPNGAEIRAINQAPIEHLLEIMRTVTAKETLSGQSRRIQLNFSWLLAAMGYAQDEYQVDYWWHGALYSQRVLGIKVETNGEVEKQTSFYGFSQLTDTTALMWMNDFEENPEVFDKFLKQKFAKMAELEIENLIIDVRYNQGGLSENLKNLLSRMTDRPVYWANQGTIKISQQLKDLHVERTRARRADKYKWGLQWLPLEWTDKLQHSIYWSDLGDTINLKLNAIKPNGNYRPKNVWVLTNGFCYSACSLFVASVNHYKLATTVGEPIGSYAKHQFAYPIHLKLPHSSISLTLPTMRFDFDAGDEDELMAPEYVIERSVEDISKRVDPVLNYALRAAESMSH